MKKIIVGIQARSTSTRLPGKAYLSIDGKPMLRHVIDACQSAARFVAKQKAVQIKTVLLIPEGDDLQKSFSDIEIVEGPEHDVLSRYIKAAEIYEPDLIARVTGDCWAMASHALSRAIKSMIVLGDSRGVEYVTNTDVMPLFKREVKEGYDSQILTPSMLHWLDKNATDAEDREHVTTAIGKAISERTLNMKWAFLGDNLSPASIDTKEQYFDVLDSIRAKKDKISQIIQYDGIYVS